MSTVLRVNRVLELVLSPNLVGTVESREASVEGVLMVPKESDFPPDWPCLERREREYLLELGVMVAEVPGSN